MVLRARRELAEPHGAQFPPNRLAAHRDAELLPQPLHQVTQPPADHAVETGLRPGLHGLGERRALIVRQERRLPRRLAIDQTRRTPRIEPKHPVAHDLQPNPSGPRRRRPRGPVIDRRQRQKPPRLTSVPARLRQPPQILRRVVRPKRSRCSHGKPPSVSHGESLSSPVGNPLRESASLSLSIRSPRDVR